MNQLTSDYGESNTAWWSPITDVQVGKDEPPFRAGTSLPLLVAGNQKLC